MLVADAVMSLGFPGRSQAEEKPRAELRGHCDPVWSIAFSPDGRSLAGVAGAGPSARLLVWDVAISMLAVAIPVASSDIIGYITFHPVGQSIAVASGKDITLYSPANPNRSIKIHDLSGDALALAFSPDGKELAVGGRDLKTGYLQLHDAATGRRRLSLRGHDKAVGGVQFTPDGKRLISTGYDKTLRVWDVASGTAVATREAHDRGVESLLVRPDGKLAVSADLGGTVYLWELPAVEKAGVLKGHPGAALSAAFRNDGKLLAVATGEFATSGEVWLWDIKRAQRVGMIRGEPLPVRSVAFSPDGKILATVCGYEPVRFWDVAAVLAGHKDSLGGSAQALYASR